MHALTRLAALGTLSRGAGEGLLQVQTQGPSPAPQERGDQARRAWWVRVALQRWVGEGTIFRPYALLCLLSLILYAPGLAAIPPLDRVEGLDYSAGGGELVLTLYRLEPG